MSGSERASEWRHDCEPRHFTISSLALNFDIALEEAGTLTASFECLDGIAAPLLILTIEDEVTGTGALVHRLTFGVTEREGKITSFATGNCCNSSMHCREGAVKETM